MSRNVIRSIRKGSVQWNEEDRLKVATLLLKAGYSVRIGRIVTDTVMHNFLPFSRQLNTDFYINIQLSTYCSDHFRLSSIFKFALYVVCQCLF